MMTTTIKKIEILIFRKIIKLVFCFFLLIFFFLDGIIIVVAVVVVINIIHYPTKMNACDKEEEAAIILNSNLPSLDESKKMKKKVIRDQNRKRLESMTINEKQTVKLSKFNIKEALANDKSHKWRIMITCSIDNIHKQKSLIAEEIDIFQINKTQSVRISWNDVENDCNTIKESYSTSEYTIYYDNVPLVSIKYKSQDKEEKNRKYSASSTATIANTDFSVGGNVGLIKTKSQNHHNLHHHQQQQSLIINNNKKEEELKSDNNNNSLTIIISSSQTSKLIITTDRKMKIEFIITLAELIQALSHLPTTFSHLFDEIKE